jgi:DNA-binding transcriptional LysR family regulator
MIEVFFVVCMAAAPAECNERRIVLGNVPPTACHHLAQPELARWMETHPDLEIRRWQCQRVS